MSDTTNNRGRQRHAAGLFDIRNIIGALLGLYGIVLLIAGIVGTSQADKDKAGGINANLWVGIVLLIVGVLFLVWARTRPVVVDEEQIARDKAAVEEAAGRPSDA